MTVLTAIRYDGGVIVGADRLVCFGNGEKEDKSKLIVRKNFAIALTGRTTKNINVFERHNRFWSKLDDYIDTKTSYFETIDTISDFLTSINLGLKQSEFARHISNMAFERPVQSYDLQMSFLYLLRYDKSISLFFDAVLQRIKTANHIYPEFCGGLEIVDFTPKNTELLYLEHIH